MVDVAALVVFSADPERTARFYRLLGIDLEFEQHDDGPVHYASQIGAVHFAVFEAESDDGQTPAWRAAGSTFAGFYVNSLETVIAEIRAGGFELLTDHQVRPWGCRFVAADPDGRPIEINERGHCSTSS